MGTYIFCRYSFHRPLVKDGPGIERWNCAKKRSLKCPGAIKIKRVGEEPNLKFYYVENSFVSHEGKDHSDLDSDIIDIHRINVRY